MNINKEILQSILENLAKSYEQTINTYGDSFERSYKRKGLNPTIQRIEDSLGKLENLLAQTKEGEPVIKNTLYEIANHAIVGLILEITKESDKVQLVQKDETELKTNEAIPTI